MPGGSVNGRPFRESSDSYSRTGIPCGNPRRFNSQDVVRMEPGVRSRSRAIDGPLEEIETEGQRHLKDILQKQLDTNITLKQQLGQKREFTRGAEFDPVSDEITGTQSLQEFRTLGDVDAYIEDMKGFGLTHEEILYKLKHDEEANMQLKKGKLSNPEYHEAKIQAIEEKIAQKKQQLSVPDQFSNVKTISRHKMDLEKAISTANPQNKFLHSTLITQRHNQPNTSHHTLMDEVPEILDSITTKVTGDSIHQRRRRRKKLAVEGYKSGCMLECCVSMSGNRSNLSDPSCDSVNMSCDMDQGSCDQTSASYEQTSGESCDCMPAVATCMERPNDFVSKSASDDKIQSEKKLLAKSTSFIVRTKYNASTSTELNTELTNLDVTRASDSVERHGTISADSSIREIRNVEPIPADAIRKYKMPPDEVRNITRFANYTPGEPNNVLFVKNLSSKVTEHDLASLFIGLQDESKDCIEFKLLNGKMKGQAFVTFPDIEDASRALELVHGYEYKGKLVVIQYGKKKPDLDTNLRTLRPIHTSWAE